MSILVADTERETAVLFAMSTRPELVTLSGLEADDFADDASRGVFALLSEALEDGRGISDADALCDAIEESRNADKLQPFIDRAGEGRWVWQSGVRGFDHHVRKLKELRVAKGKQSGAKTEAAPKAEAGADQSDDAPKPEAVGV